jgi:hypothetical protein
MDSPELVTEVKLTSDKHFLQFYIDKAAIAQGNAVVAIRNTAGEIMWSWHIWVTPLVSPTAPATDLMINRTDDHYEFMQYNLGWATATTMNYGAGNGTQPRQIQVKITQTGISNPAIETFTVLQSPASVITKGNSPFWSWGRKDPLPPNNGLVNGADGERTLWYGGAAYKFNSSSAQLSLGAAIKNPLRKINFDGNWCSTNYNNLWDAPNAAIGSAAMPDTTIVKTVYDPNPVGFKMPPINAWTRFLLPGNTASANMNDINAVIFQNGGYNFYTQADREGPTAVYPIAGTRPYNSMNVTVTSGYYFSATPQSDVVSYSLALTNSNVNIRSKNRRSLAMSVRPITD